MNSATVQDYIRYVSPPTTAIVEQLPSNPEFYQWIAIQQQHKTQAYTVDNLWDSPSSVKFVSTETLYSEEQQISIIKNAQLSIRSNIKDLDPEIRSLVSKNFKDLLWK